METMILILIGVVLCWWALRPLWKMGMKLCFVVMVILLLAMYGFLGGGQQLVKQMRLQTASSDMAASLQNPKGQDKVLAQLAKVASAHPDDAQGWYWLGRMQQRVGKVHEAGVSLAKAYALMPDHDVIGYHYAQALFMDAGERLNDISKAVLLGILGHKPYQQHALNLLALDAYQRETYGQSLLYWEAILAHDHLDDSDHSRIAAMVSLAKQKGGVNPGRYRLRIAMPESACRPDHGMGFLVIRSKINPDMAPLAVKRVDFSSLDHMVEITQDDQMLPHWDMAPFERVEVKLIKANGIKTAMKRHQFIAKSNLKKTDIHAVKLYCRTDL
jgi:cytochrome c-type biogenesis protein CcmH